MEETQTHIHRGAPRCAHRRVSAVTERAERARARFHLRKAPHTTTRQRSYGLCVCTRARGDGVFLQSSRFAFVRVCVMKVLGCAIGEADIYTRAVLGSEAARCSVRLLWECSDERMANNCYKSKSY